MLATASRGWLRQMSSSSAYVAGEANPLASTAPISLVSSVMAAPHPEKTATGSKAQVGRNFGFAGEDAYFIRRGRRGSGMIGVADGVSKWREEGIDAGLYSQKLMELSAAAVDRGLTEPQEVLAAAWRELSSIKPTIKGSCTACLVTLDTNEHALVGANLGDSGYFVIRDGKCIFESESQELRFQTPYQLGHSARWTPDDAALAVTPVRPGDVVVIATDGLMQNANSDEIAEQVGRHLNGGGYPTELASRLVRYAYDRSVERTVYKRDLQPPPEEGEGPQFFATDLSRQTEFAIQMMENLGTYHEGGKLDDITVIAGVVKVNTSV